MTENQSKDMLNITEKDILIITDNQSKDMLIITDNQSKDMLNITDNQSKRHVEYY